MVALDLGVVCLLDDGMRFRLSPRDGGDALKIPAAHPASRSASRVSM